MSRLQQLQHLLADQPDDLFLNFALAMELAKLGRLDDAVARFDRVLQLDPTYSPAYLHKARTLLAAKQPQQAKQTIHAGITVARQTGETHTADKLQELLQSLDPA
jgi:predicted Zn-dependent protease